MELSPTGATGVATPDLDLGALAEFRYQIRLWTRISEEAARAVGLPPQHQQTLLAIKGYPEGQPRIVDLAERMQLRHHSMVGLLDRMQEDGLITRSRRPDGRGVAVLMTDRGEELLGQSLSLLQPKLPGAASTLIQALTSLAGA
jgi:DNA-binding MarR family transcriptional regulator